MSAIGGLPWLGFQCVPACTATCCAQGYNRQPCIKMSTGQQCQGQQQAAMNSPECVGVVQHQNSGTAASQPFKSKKAGWQRCGSTVPTQPGPCPFHPDCAGYAIYTYRCYPIGLDPMGPIGPMGYFPNHSKSAGKISRRQRQGRTDIRGEKEKESAI